MVRKTYKGRLTKKVSEEDPQMPEIVPTQIGVGFEEIDGKNCMIFECPMCKVIFSLPAETIEKILEVDKMKREGKPIKKKDLRYVA